MESLNIHSSETTEKTPSADDCLVIKSPRTSTQEDLKIRLFCQLHYIKIFVDIGGDVELDYQRTL